MKLRCSSLAFLGFPTYAVGRKGTIWSKRNKKWRKRKVGTNCWGHKVIYLYREGIACFFFVHHLVLEAFVGPCPDGMECRHLDGNPGNNRVDNLEWGTKAQNMRDRDKHGKLPKGENHWNCRITSQEVEDIKWKRSNGYSRKEVAEEYNLSPTMVSLITHDKARKAG